MDKARSRLGAFVFGVVFVTAVFLLLVDSHLLR